MSREEALAAAMPHALAILGLRTALLPDERRFEARLRAGLAILVIAALAVSGLALWANLLRSHTRELAQQARHEMAVTTQFSEAVSRYVVEARGLVVVGDRAAGLRFEAARAIAAAAMRNVERVHGEHPAHAETVASLRQEIATFFAYHDGVSELVRSGDVRQALERLRSGEGQARLDAIYESSDRIRRDEQRVLEEYQSESARRENWLWLAGLAAVLVQIALIALGYTALGRELRRRAEAAQALATSERVQRATFEQAAVGIAHITPERRILRANRRLAQLLGYPVERLAGMAVQDLSHAEDREAVTPGRAQLYAGEAAHVVTEKRYLRADGTPLWMRVTVALARDAAGKPEYEIAVFEDISAERRAAAELRRFRAALDTSQDAVYIMSANRARIVDVNEAACRMLGYAREELVGADPRMVLAESGVPLEKIAAMRDAVRASPTGFTVGEIEHRRKDGSVVPVEIQRSALEVEGEAYVVSVARDISERRRQARLLALEHEVTRCIAAAGNASAAMRDAIRIICESQNWDTGRYFAADEGGGPLRCRETWSAPGAALETFIELSSRLTFAADEGIVGRVWQSGEPLWVEDTTSDPRALNRVLSVQSGLHSAFAIPVTAESRTLGVLAISSRQVREPDQRLLAAMRVIGSQIGQFLRRKQAEDAARAFAERLASYSQLSPVISYALKLQGDRLRPAWISENIERLLGYTAAEALAAGWWEAHLHPEDRERVLAGTATLLREGALTSEYRFLRRDGSALWVRDELCVARDAAGAPSQVVGAWTDITEAKRAEAELERLAHYDSVTGLPNRALFRDRLEQALAQAARNQWQVGLLLVDFDHFKRINDTLGHAAGDALLREAGARLHACLRAGDTVARLGGDEFAVVLPDLESPDAAGVVADKMLAALKAPFQVGGQEVQLGASIGITVYPLDAPEIEALISNADIAMYRAKDTGRNRYQFFAPEMNAGAVQRLALEKDLRHALERDEFELHYQPKAEVNGGGVTGVEALLRWRRPGGVLVPPAEFIPLLEETGLIAEVGDWVIKEACRQLTRWNGNVPTRLSVAVNVSARQFRGGRLLTSVREALAAAGSAAERLQIEITESMAMHEVDVTIETLQALRALGVRVAVDDFGTGYSSLAYLKRLPVDVIKIDRAFVREVNENASDAAIARAIVAMGRALGYRVVAEGVETQLQRQALEAYGCDEIQGYLLSRPLPPDRFLDWLAERR